MDSPRPPYYEPLRQPHLEDDHMYDDVGARQDNKLLSYLNRLEEQQTSSGTSGSPSDSRRKAVLNPKEYLLTKSTGGDDEDGDG